MKVNIVKLKETLSARGYICMRDPGGGLFVAPPVSQVGYESIAPEDFVQLLNAKDITINADTLDITYPAVTTPTPPDDTDDTPDLPADPTPPSDIWTKQDLELLSYNDIRKLAGKFDDVKGNQSKAELVAALTGRPK